MAAPSLAATPALPALVDPPSSQHIPGKMVFAELVTPDLAAAKLFYGRLFGWVFADTKIGPFTFSQAVHDKYPVAGLVQKEVPTGTEQHAVWLTFLAVKDVDAAQAVAVQQGAKVLFAPRTIADFGREDVLADPQGAVFALLASSSGDPPDSLADDGEWIWSSLLTSDPDQDAAFYQNVLGYDVFDVSADQPGQHLILASGTYARASVNPLPLQAPNVHPRWLDYIRVEDAVVAARQVATLGGRVLVAPHMDRHGGMVAVVADPSGGVFGLLEWRNDLGSGQSGGGAVK